MQPIFVVMEKMMYQKWYSDLTGFSAQTTSAEAECIGSTGKLSMAATGNQYLEETEKISQNKMFAHEQEGLCPLMSNMLAHFGFT